MISGTSQSSFTRRATLYLRRARAHNAPLAAAPAPQEKSKTPKEPAAAAASPVIAGVKAGPDGGAREDAGLGPEGGG
jgi:hypothetical protein